MLQFLSENKDLRHECQVLAMEYRKILYSDAPLGWGNIPVDLRGDWSSFCVRKSSLGSAAGNGVFATKIIQPGTALCYGGSMVPPIDEYPPFDIDAYALEWGENCTVIGIPARIVTLSDNRQILSGYLGPTVNEPRKCKAKRISWKKFPRIEQCNCVFGSSDAGLYVVVCRQIGRSFQTPVGVSQNTHHCIRNWGRALCVLWRSLHRTRRGIRASCEGASSAVRCVCPNFKRFEPRVRRITCKVRRFFCQVLLSCAFGCVLLFFFFPFFFSHCRRLSTVDALSAPVPSIQCDECSFASLYPNGNCSSASKRFSASR